MPNAVCIGSYKGKRVFRVPVKVSLNDSRALTSRVLRFEVIARTPAEAANWVRDQIGARPETEIYAYGPKGGETYRFIGWESSVWAAMMAPKPPEQFQLFEGAKP